MCLCCQQSKTSNDSPTRTELNSTQLGAVETKTKPEPKTKTKPKPTTIFMPQANM